MFTHSRYGGPECLVRPLVRVRYRRESHVQVVSAVMILGEICNFVGELIFVRRVLACA